MNLRYLLSLLLLLCCSIFRASSSSVFDDIRMRLEQAPIQEKVYLHLDNNCYFMGDTIWYKAYVVRADDLRYTDMSRILYVELVGPEGIVVQRQMLIASEQGYGDGNFVLKDSFYAGYYELRAYTRWMLNFCVAEHPHRWTDREQFYNSEIAHDFFREYGAVYSRVVPVYDRPDMPGEYDLRFMTPRKKMRQPALPDPTLNVAFYPEGGQLVAGTRCRVAFEATNQDGMGVNVEGTVNCGGVVQTVRATYLGRGDFYVDVPHKGQGYALFTYEDKEYRFDLPKPQVSGCSLQLTQDETSVEADIALRGFNSSDSVAAVILCRGRLLAFQSFPATQASTKLYFDNQQLCTGVCNLIILDSQGQPVADRLFFVNRHDYDEPTVRISSQHGQLMPLQAVSLQLEAPAEARHLSISIRDRKTDELTYDNGSMLTDLLLGSELQGFVADPRHYFDYSIPQRSHDLELLMLVQGWRRYDYSQMISSVPLRYQPEQNLSVEGDVFQTVDFVDAQTSYVLSIDSFPSDSVASEYEDKSASDLNYLGEHPRLKHEVIVDGELVLQGEVGDVQVSTFDSGHFAFNLPAFLGDARLFLSAHKSNASDRHLKKMREHDRFNEGAWPDFYVKRQLIYPVFAKPYNYYQCHLPESKDSDDDYYWWLSPGQQMVRISSMDTRLENVEVRAMRHHGSRSVDLDQPLCTFDAYDIYNLLTDYGLSYGKFNYRRFAHDIVSVLFGSYDNTGVSPIIQTRTGDDLDPSQFNPNDPLEIEAEKMSNFTRMQNMQLKRIDSVQVFTDFNLRQYDDYLERNGRQWDVLVRYIMLPGGGERYTYRDRRIDIPGIYCPAEFYHPDYSRRPLPQGQNDYRRTLYWNPNLMLDSEGRCNVIFYNNSTASELSVSVAGLTSDGRPVIFEQ